MSRIFAVSDGTGTTADLVIRAALSQFNTQVRVERVAGVRSIERVQEIVAAAAAEHTMIVHTLVSDALRKQMDQEGKRQQVVTVDLMGPLLIEMGKTLSVTPRSEPGVFNLLDAEYLQRIEALNFAVQHDDGQRPADLPEADVVLVGVSRSAKTPLSISLAYRGWRVANVPLVIGIEPPAGLFELPGNKVIGLTVSAGQLAELRNTGTIPQGSSRLFYTDPEQIRKEIALARDIFENRGDWNVVDMTNKSVEVATLEIISLIGQQPEEVEV